MNLRRYWSEEFLWKHRKKAPVLVSPKHIEFVKRRACVATGLISPEMVDAHHVQFRSHGQIDYTCVPLKHDIHIGELHGKGTDFVEKKYGIDLKDALIATLIERVVELEERLKN